MTTVTPTELRHYYKQVKLLIPINGKDKKRFLNDLQGNIDNYIENNKDVAMKDIMEHFGTPPELVSDYIKDLDSDEIYKKVSNSVIIKRLIASIIFVLLLIGIVWTVFLYKGYKEASDHYIDREVITIEEY